MDAVSDLPLSVSLISMPYPPLQRERRAAPVPRRPRGGNPAPARRLPPSTARATISTANARALSVVPWASAPFSSANAAAGMGRAPTGYVIPAVPLAERHRTGEVGRDVALGQINRPLRRFWGG